MFVCVCIRLCALQIVANSVECAAHLQHLAADIGAPTTPSLWTRPRFDRSVPSNGFRARSGGPSSCPRCARPRQAPSFGTGRRSDGRAVGRGGLSEGLAVVRPAGRADGRSSRAGVADGFSGGGAVGRLGARFDWQTVPLIVGRSDSSDSKRTAPYFAEIGHAWPGFGQLRPMFGMMRPTLRRTKFGPQIQPSQVRGPDLTDLRKISPNIHRSSSPCIRSNSAQVKPQPVKLRRDLDNSVDELGGPDLSSQV